VDDQDEMKRSRRRQGPIRRSFEPSPGFADSFGLVLVLLILSFFVLAVAGDDDWGRIASLITIAATTWLALRASQVQRRILRLALALIPLATLLAIVLVLVGSERTATLVGGIVSGLLVVVAPVAILRRLLAHPVVSLNTFYGAVCVYLLIAMLFATLFRIIGVVDDPFFVQMQATGDKATQIDYLYFAFITMTTVGYGDLTAASGVGRMTAALLAIFGQLYLITVVALVVQNLGQKKVLEHRVHEDQAEQAAEEQAVKGDPSVGGAGPRAGDPDARP